MNLVIWTTDHGDAFPRAKRAVYDSGINVPMIVRFPDEYGKGTVRDELVSFVDLAPTILELAGADVPDFIQGESFLDPAERIGRHRATSGTPSASIRTRCAIPAIAPQAIQRCTIRASCRHSCRGASAEPPSSSPFHSGGSADTLAACLRRRASPRDVAPTSPTRAANSSI